MPAGTKWHEAAAGRRLARVRTRRPKADASSIGGGHPTSAGAKIYGRHLAQFLNAVYGYS